MINFKYRFHGHGSLTFLYHNGKIKRSGFLTIKYLSNNYRKTSRFSVIISKKIAKTAVLRNRIRRRIYEIIRQEIPNITAVYDVAIIVNSIEINNLSYLDLKSKLLDLFKQAELL